MIQKHIIHTCQHQTSDIWHPSSNQSTPVGCNRLFPFGFTIPPLATELLLPACSKRRHLCRCRWWRPARKIWGFDMIWLVVGPPLWKIWKSIGMMTFPIYGKIKNVPNHQPGIQSTRMGLKQHKTYLDNTSQYTPSIPALWWPFRHMKTRIIHGRSTFFIQETSSYVAFVSDP